MNFGDCPYCGDFIGFLAVPEKTPAYAKVTCESCGKEIWYRLSRVDPKSWTIEDFEKESDIDEINKRVVKKLADEDIAIIDDKYLCELEDFILNGDPGGLQPVGILKARDSDV